MSEHAWFQLNIKEDGLYIILYPSENGGQSLSPFEINLYLAKISAGYIDKSALNQALEFLSETTEVKLGEAVIPPVDESLTVKISNDKMKAVVRVYAASNGGRQLNKNDFLAKLLESGVKFGIIEQTIDEWLKDRKYCVDLFVAEGVAAEESRDAFIEYKFRTKIEFGAVQDERGNVDFNKLDLINHVSKGDVLAVLTPAYEGEYGTNVLGQGIPSERPIFKRLDCGGHAELSEDECVVTSAVDGHVELTMGKIVVHNVYSIRGDVGVATGDIDYNGSVKISGDVLSGYSVKATGDIMVSGVVEAAFLTAGGQIMLSNGIHGETRGVIRAEGDVTAQFIQSGVVYSGGNVTCRSILHSMVSAKGSITVDARNGFVKGGELKAGGFISVRDVGSANTGANTLLELESDDNGVLEYQELEKQLVEMRAEQRKILQVVKIRAASIPPNQMELLKSRLSALGAEISEMLERFEQLRADMETDDSRKIIVNGTVYEGAKITIANVSYYVNRAASKCQFLKEGMEIKNYPLV